MTSNQHFISVPMRRAKLGDKVDARLVGREGTLAAIHEQLGGLRDVPLVHDEESAGSVQLSGTAGVGKSALALEYCYRFKQDYQCIWWVDGETASTVRTAQEKYCAAFGLIVRQDQDIANVVEAHLAKLASVLVVYDNVADAAAYAELSPPHAPARTLVTSRSPHYWDNKFPVELISDDDAIDWILFAKHHKTSPFGADRAEFAADEVAAAKMLSERLGGLALALTMATTYLAKYKATTIQAYVEAFDADSASLLNNMDVLPPGYTKTVSLTFAVTLRKLVTENRHAAKLLLEYISFYAPSRIPQRIFNPEALKSKDPNAISVAIGDLESLSLIDYDEPYISVHRLVQDVTRYYLQNPLPDIAVDEARSRGERRVVLLVEANPIDENKPLAANQELKDIKAVIASSPVKDLVTVEMLLAANSDDLVRALRDHDPAVVHFCGHSVPGFLVLHDPSNPRARADVDADDLRTLFANHDVRIVVLNSCYSQDIAESFNEIVPVVVGTVDEVGDSDARDFAVGFYTTLMKNHAVSNAYKDGTATVALRDGENVFLYVGDDDHSGITIFG